MPTYRMFFAALLGALIWVSGASALQPDSAVAPAAATSQGAWKEVAGGRLLLWEPERLVIRSGDNLEALTLLQQSAGEITVRNEGMKEIWKVTRGSEILRLEHAGHSEEYRRLPSVPPELDLSPLPLGHPEKLAPERVQEIQKELIRRRDLDQVTIRDSAHKERFQAVNTDNRSYLDALVQSVGWIDSTRFGRPAAAAAIILAKHGHDPRLMQAILPSW